MIDNKFLIPIVAFFVALGGCYFLGDIVIKKITTRIVEELRKSYSPGPYSPGFDPDKISPRIIWNNQEQPDRTRQLVSPERMEVPIRQRSNDTLSSPQDWNKMWEESRNMR